MIPLIHLISSDEPWLVEQRRQELWQKASAEGFNERRLIAIEHKADWERLQSELANRSLFSPKRYFELHLANGKPGDYGSDILIRYAEHPNPDDRLIILLPKLDGAMKKAKWFTRVSKVAELHQLWPLKPAQFKPWLQQRLQEQGLKTSDEGLHLLAEHLAGNLFAAVQEIEKMRLNYGQGPLSVEQIAKAISQHSRYTLFELTDACLTRQPAEALKRLDCLLAEGTEPVLILWALCREIRLLAQIAYGLERGEKFAALTQKLGLWQTQSANYQVALKDRNSGHFYALLQQAQSLDVLIKGYGTGTVAEALSDLCLALAG